MLRRFGARFTPSLANESDPTTIRVSALYEACDLFVRAENVLVRTPGGEPARWRKREPGPDSVYVVPDESRLSLDLSKNILVHFFVSRAMIATPLVAGGGTVTVSELRERVQALSRLFKYEFMFRADAPFDQIFDETVAEMVRDGELTRQEDPQDTIAIAPGDLGENVALYAEVVRNFVEGYRVAARALAALLKGALTPKDLAKRAITVGDRMFLAGELERREAVSRPLFENAQMAFIDQGYLTRAEGKLALAASYAQPAAVKTIESRIAGFLPRARATGST
jgi:glycerol-3-phosphate O-acyltransferase